MNTCGLDHVNIYTEFVDENEIKTILDQFHFHEWYDSIKDNIKTPKSWIFEINELKKDNIQKQIDLMENKECFARLDSLSTKPLVPYRSTYEIEKDIYSCSRTYNEINNNTKLIIREWVVFKNEFRCFIHGGEIRAINTENNEIVEKYLANIKDMVNKIIKLTDYYDCVIDFGFIEDELTLVEINSPVYLASTSGNFDLTLPYDYELLLGDYNKEIFNYPVIRSS
jgi:hypothetical protein